MTPITGPYSGVEADYRRSRITASFREHRKARRASAASRRRAAQPVAVITETAAKTAYPDKVIDFRGDEQDLQRNALDQP